MQKISQKIRKIYQDKFKTYGLDSKSLNWKRLGASHQRFRQIWAGIDFNHKSVLDVGCGFGELARFLPQRYEEVSYTGIDLVPEFIEVAKSRFPKYRFLARDYLEKPLDEKFDVIVASGILNTNVSNNMEYRKKAIQTMFRYVKGVFVFNMLGGYPQPKNNSKSNIWYADSLEILKYCLSLTRRVVLRHHYNPKDFTIFMYKIKKQ
ncbi:MAG: class I SAM-dependent methyltransferase [Patescibacteria group bacterium]